MIPRLSILADYCYSPLNDLQGCIKGESYVLMDEQSRCNYYIPNTTKNTNVYVLKKIEDLKKFYRESTCKFTTKVMKAASGAFCGWAITKGLSLINAPKSVYFSPTHFKTSSKNAKYIELTRRVKNLDLLESKLDSLPNPDKFIYSLKECLNKQNWGFNNPDYPYYALLSVKIGKMSPIQFGTIMRFYSLTLEHSKNEIQSISLFDQNGESNPLALEYISKTMKFDERIWLDEKGMADFMQEMKNFPISEQQFFVIMDKNDPDKCYERDFPHYSPTISHVVMQNARFNVFGRFKDSKGNSLRIIPSLGMVQGFVKIVYPNTFVRVNPVLGLSSSEDIRKNGLNHTRDIALSFPGIPLPSSADGRKVLEEYDFSYHDDYHLITASGIPEKEMKKFLLISDLINNYMKKKNLESDPVLQSFSRYFTEMEMFAFRNDKKHLNFFPKHYSYTEFFWHSVIKISPAISRFHTEILSLIIDKKEIMENDESILKGIAQDLRTEFNLSGLSQSLRDASEKYQVFTAVENLLRERNKNVNR